VKLTRSLFAASLLSCSLSYAAELEPLPEPLSLEAALKLAAATPAQQAQMANESLAQAQLSGVEASDDATIDFRARARWIDPSYKSTDPSHNDSSASITVRKELYDFGQSEAELATSQQSAEAQAFETQRQKQLAQLAVMRAFYDVVLSDLAFARDNEWMAIAYIQADRAKQRNEMGQVNDVDMLALEAVSQEVRRRRFESESRQRLTRAQLALAMGRPGDLVSTVALPTVELPKEDPEDFDAYWNEVLKNNLQLKRLRQQRDAAKLAVKAAKQSDGPRVVGELDSLVMNRSTGSTHPFAAGLLFEVPLSRGGRTEAAVASAEAKVTSAEAALRLKEYELRDQALKLWLARSDLRAKLQEQKAKETYRDVYLDRSRALYELELKADLGDAMTKTSEVRLDIARVLFDWAMNEAKIKAMVGRLGEAQ
jgi:outer membrane protein TolC